MRVVYGELLLIAVHNESPSEYARHVAPSRTWLSARVEVGRRVARGGGLLTIAKVCDPDIDIAIIVGEERAIGVLQSSPNAVDM
jgi:hypothetical protein